MIYEINNRILDFLEIIQDEELSLEIYKDTLESLYIELSINLENFGQYILNQKYTIQNLEAEIKKLQEKKREKEKKIEKQEEILLNYMKEHSIKKIDNIIKINIRKSERINVIDEKNLIKYSKSNNLDILEEEIKIKISKNTIKKYLKIGIDIPFVEIEQKESICIK